MLLCLDWQYALKVFVRKPKDHNSLVAQHIWEAVGANDKKSVYRLIVNFEAEVNHVNEQGSCNSSLTLSKAMLLQEQQIMGDHGNSATLLRDKPNLMFIGDGRSNTIIAASESVAGGNTTFNSATVGNYSSKLFTFTTIK